MQFLKEIRAHLQDFETEVSDEIHKFIDFLHTKYGEVQPAVVPPPNPIGNYVPSTYDIPVVAPPPEEEEIIIKPKAKKIPKKLFVIQEEEAPKIEEETIVIQPKKRVKKPKNLSAVDWVELGEEIKERLPEEGDKINLKVSSYYMNNREIFIQFICGESGHNVFKSEDHSCKLYGTATREVCPYSPTIGRKRNRIASIGL